MLLGKFDYRTDPNNNLACKPAVSGLQPLYQAGLQLPGCSACKYYCCTYYCLWEMCINIKVTGAPWSSY